MEPCMKAIPDAVLITFFGSLGYNTLVAVLE